MLGQVSRQMPILKIETQNADMQVKVPDGMTSWDFFDVLLEKTQVVGTPGSGFGPAGEGFFRLTGFGSAEKTLEAVERIKNAKF